MTAKTRALVAMTILTTVVISSPMAAGDASSVRVERLDEGVWIFESDTDWNGSVISANGLIVGDDERVLVVDTPWTDGQTNELLDWIEDNIGLPVRYFVITHAHNDRIGGIGAVHARGIATVAFEGSLEPAATQGFELPQITFRERLVIELDNDRVALLYPGAGHAPDNIVVWLEERRWLFGGCFVKDSASRGLGYTGDADLEAWSESLERLESLTPRPRKVIPGHGAPGGPELLEHTRRLLDEHASRGRNSD